jgi:nuclear pore complex protein Nup160
MFPDDILEPPTPSSEIWTMAEFKILTTASISTKIISILWKNNTSSRIQNLEIDILTVPEQWKSPWIAVASETLRDAPLPVTSDVEPSGMSEKWADYFFYPDRFSTSTLETAISIYEQSIKIKLDMSKTGFKTLSERMCSAIASQVVLGRVENGTADFERFSHDTDLQWRRLYRIAADLGKRRFEALSLAIDEEAGLQWLVTCGGVSALHNCSDIEILQHNHRDTVKSKEFRLLCKSRRVLHKIEGSAQKLEGILSAATSFRESFSSHLSYAFDAILDSEVFSEPSFSVPERIKIFYDRCNFAGHVGDDEYSSLLSSLEDIGGVSALSTHLMNEIIQMLLRGPSRADDGTATEIGVKIMNRLAQETININLDILKGLLALIVFVDIEMEKDEDDNMNLDVADIFIELLSLIKGHRVLCWLSQRTVLQKNSTASQGQEGVENEFKDSQKDSRHVSLLQQLITEVATLPSIENQHGTFAERLEPHAQLMLWNTGLMEEEKYDQRVIAIQSNLLRNGELDLAEDFSKFLPSTEAACYLKGRLDMCLSDFVSASAFFKKAAYGLCKW